MLPVCLSVCSGQERSPLQTPAALVCRSWGFSVLRGQLCGLPEGHASCLARCWSIFYHRCDVSSPFVRRENTFFIVPQRLWQESGGTGDRRIWKSCFWTRRDEASALHAEGRCWGLVTSMWVQRETGLYPVCPPSTQEEHTHTRHRAIHTPFTCRLALALWWTHWKEEPVQLFLSVAPKFFIKHPAGPTWSRAAVEVKSLASQQTGGCFVPGG